MPATLSDSAFEYLTNKIAMYCRYWDRFHHKKYDSAGGNGKVFPPLEAQDEDPLSVVDTVNEVRKYVLAFYKGLFRDHEMQKANAPQSTDGTSYTKGFDHGRLDGGEGSKLGHENDEKWPATLAAKTKKWSATERLDDLEDNLPDYFLEYSFRSIHARDPAMRLFNGRTYPLVPKSKETGY